MADSGPPQHPLLELNVEPAIAAVSMTVLGQDNVLTADQAGFETSAASYVGTNATVARSTAFAADGSASLAVTSVGAGTVRAASPAGTAGAPIADIDTYTGLVSLRAASTVRSFRAVIIWYTAAGALISENQGPTVTGSNSTFVQATVTVTPPPAGAAFAAIAVDILSVAAGGEVHYLDKTSVAPGHEVIWTRGGLVPQQRFLIEHSIDGGVTWQSVRLPVFVVGPLLPSALIPQVGTPGLNDYEVPFGVPVQYRAYTVSNPGGVGAVTVTSDALAPLTVTIPFAGSAWLKDPNDPTLNRAVCLVTPPLVSTSSQPQQVFSGLGDPNWSVSSDVAKGEAGDVTLSFDGDVAFGAFEALRNPPRTLLLQTGYGDHGSEQMYVRLGPDRTVTRLPTKADGLQARVVTVGYRQVQEPT